LSCPSSLSCSSPADRMALTRKTEQDLSAAGLTDFFEKEKKLWQPMAEHAFDYTNRFIDPVRQDDVLQLLQPELQVCEPLRRYLSEKKLREKYWYERFGELVIDRLWPDLIKRSKA